MKRRKTPAKTKNRTARLRKKGCGVSVASKPSVTSVRRAHSQSDSSLTSSIWPAEFMQLATVLKRLLSLEADLFEPADGAPFVGAFLEIENDLLKVPVLVALLAGLPISNEQLERKTIIPLVRAILPKSKLKMQPILKGEDPKGASELIDALYLKAVVLDSTHVRELCDRVLFRLAVDCDLNSLLPRLVSRFFEVYLSDVSRVNSLREWVFEAAQASVNLMRLRAGAPAGTVLRKQAFSRNLQGESLADELLHIAVTSQVTWDNGIRVWIETKKGQIAESDPDFIANFVTVSAPPERASRFGSALSRQKRQLEDLICELECLERHLKDEQNVNPNRERDDGSGFISSDPELDIFLDPAGSGTKGLENTEVEDADPALPENEHSENPSTPDHSVVVVPKLELTGNRDLDSRLKPLKELLAEKPIPLLATPDLTPVRAKMIGLLPHLKLPIDRIMNAMAAHACIKIPPIILVGPPGSGKTTLLQVLAEELDLPFTVINGAGSSDANWLGVDMRWSTGALGVHLDLIQTHQIANPLIILDEIEKFGGSARNGDARARLLGLLEPRRAASFFDPYLSMPINLRSMNWAFTANSIRGIPEPLQNRLEIVQCPAPARQHLPLLAPQLLLAEFKDRGLHEAWSEPLNLVELQQLNLRWKGGSIRNLKRLISVIVDSRMKFLSSA